MAVFLFEACWRESVFWPFPPIRPPAFLGLWPSSTIFKASNTAFLWLCVCHHVSFSDSPLLPSFIFKIPGDYIGSNNKNKLPISNQLISSLHSICNLNSPLPCKVACSQVLQLRYGYLWGEGTLLCLPNRIWLLGPTLICLYLCSSSWII